MTLSHYHRLSTILGYVLALPMVVGQAYYITPNQSNTTCPDDPCLNLTQYVLHHAEDSNITLLFLPGKHILSSNFRTINAANLSLRVAPTANTSSESSVATVSCEPSAGFLLQGVGAVFISGIQFIGCEHYAVIEVRLLTLEDCSLQNGTGLYLEVVDSAKIVRSSFASNSGITVEFTRLHGEVKRGAYAQKGFSIVENSRDYSEIGYLRGKFGGGIFALRSFLSIRESLFDTNVACEGGAVYLHKSKAAILKSNFSRNMANGDCLQVNTGNGVFSSSIYADSNSTKIYKSYFIGNRQATGFDGAVLQFDITSEAMIDNCNFDNPETDLELMVWSHVVINHTIIGNTSHTPTGQNNIGAFDASLEIYNSIFQGVTPAVNGQLSNATIVNCTFNNSVSMDGQGSTVYFYGGDRQTECALTINDSRFHHNTVKGKGGGLAVFGCNINMSNCIFTDNVADSGGAIYIQSSTLTTTGFLEIIHNTAMSGIVFGRDSTLTFSGITTILNNNASLYAFASNVTFVGNTSIANNSHNSSMQEGGAVTSFQSEIVFTGTVELMYNQANNGTGGAIVATESKIYTYGDTTIAHNTALSGGGIYTRQSELNFNGGTANIWGNIAVMRGGGIHAVATTVKLSGGELRFIKNRAKRGGGICLELNAKVYVVKAEAECLWNDNQTFLFEQNCDTHANPPTELKLEFTNNSAAYGGALYVSDDTNSGTCSANTEQVTSIISECFFQALALHSRRSVALNVHNTYFDSNSANISGGTIFGGLLDRCTISPYAEIFNKLKNLSTFSLNATSFLTNSNITNLQTRDIQTEISSKPVRVCFCRKHQPDCSYQPATQKVQKGQAFSISLVAVDQVNNPVPSTVRASLLSHDGGFGEGQDIQSTTSNCTQLNFSIFSPHNSEQLVLYADGPCKDTGISQTHIKVKFLPCVCPVGFKQSIIGNCICKCDHKIYPDYVKGCSNINESVQTKENIWISYINTTEQEGYMNYTHCPFDYCKPSTDHDPVWVNLNVPNGANAQCAFNRAGKLCGSCEDGLSLTLGSSHCMPCSNNWLALLIVFAIAGIALVAFLLVCNLTVAAGTINGLIFYANILVTNRVMFFPFESPNFFTVFIAWINLDFGFVTCFFDGMTGYSKTWLQLAFPVYIIFLVAMVIKLCEHSTRFSEILSKYNPIPTLATLILLSYTKFLRTIISTWQFATIEYPDGSHERLWLFDANVKYLEWKHVPLFIVTLLLFLIGLVLTFLLIAWQWLQYCYKIRAMWWIRSTKLYSFIDAYHNPYNGRHRYWTGLLLLARVLLYLVSTLSGAVTNDPRVNLFTIICVVGSLLMWKEVMKEKVYKQWWLNVLDSSFLFNLIIFSAGTYHVRETRGNQAALAYTSTSIACTTFLANLVYHTFAFILPRNFNLKTKFSHFRLKQTAICTEEERTPLIKPLPEHKKCTYSVIDVPRKPDIERGKENKIEPLNSFEVIIEKAPSTIVTNDHTSNYYTDDEEEKVALPAAHCGTDTNDPQRATVTSEHQHIISRTLSRHCLDYTDVDDIDRKGIEREKELEDFMEVY